MPQLALALQEGWATIPQGVLPIDSMVRRCQTVTNSQGAQAHYWLVMTLPLRPVDLARLSGVHYGEVTITN